MDKIIYLSLARKSVRTRLDVVQSTTGPNIKFIIEDYTPPPNSVARIYIKKEAGEVYNTCTLYNNEVTYKPTAGSFDEAGICEAQLIITQGSTVLASFIIDVFVEKNLSLGSAAPASTEFGVLQDLINDAQAYELLVNANNITGVNNRQGWIALQEGQDLNSIIAPGIYNTNSAISATLLNNPAADQGNIKLTVEYSLNSDAYIRQTIETGLKDTNGKVWTRQKSSTGETGWSDWVLMPLRREIDTLANLGAKNLLPSIAPTTTLNGVTFTRNNDGSYTVNGTATGGNATLYLGTSNNATTILDISKTEMKGGNTYLMTGCPEGGSASTYGLSFQRAIGSNTNLYRDIGDGVSIPITDAVTGYRHYIVVYEGTTVNNLTFYPMIRDASIQDDTYVPYGMSNADLTALTLPNNISGANSRQGWNMLTNGQDLNSVTTPGMYYTSTNAIASSLLNCPTTLIFKMLVEYTTVTTRVKQTITPNDTTLQGYKWERWLDVNNSFVGEWILSPLRSELDAIASLGGKNILQNDSKSETISGVDFIVNLDGSVTANGTATKQAQFVLWSRLSNNWFLKPGKYILSGCVGGSSSTYELAINATINGASSVRARDYGNGVSFTVSDGTQPYGAYILVRAGATLNNVTFYPMLRYSEIQDDTYVPPAWTNAELTNTLKATLNNLGSKNFLSINRISFNGGELNGLTYQQMDNGLIFLNGTTTAATTLYIHTGDLLPKSNGPYKLVISGFGTNDTNGGGVYGKVETESSTVGTRLFSSLKDGTYVIDNEIGTIWFYFASGVKIDNKTIGIMIMDARIEDETYVQYSIGTNELSLMLTAFERELTPATQNVWTDEGSRFIEYGDIGYVLLQGQVKTVNTSWTTILTGVNPARIRTLPYAIVSHTTGQVFRVRVNNAEVQIASPSNATVPSSIGTTFSYISKPY